MRDDRTKWQAFRKGQKEDITHPGISISEFLPERLTLISGPVDAAFKFAGVKSAIAWPDVATGQTHALSIRRDRIILVNGPEISDGWYSQPGLAVSDMTAGYRSCNVVGPLASETLARGAEIDPSIPSASVARAFAGYPVFLHVYEAGHAFRLYASRAYFEGLWGTISSFSSAIES